MSVHGVSPYVSPCSLSMESLRGSAHGVSPWSLSMESLYGVSVESLLIVMCNSKIPTVEMNRCDNISLICIKYYLGKKCQFESVGE